MRVEGMGRRLKPTSVTLWIRASNKVQAGCLERMKVSTSDLRGSGPISESASQSLRSIQRSFGEVNLRSTSCLQRGAEFFQST
jgi:hypothetical protein